VAGNREFSAEPEKADQRNRESAEYFSANIILTNDAILDTI
jgi:hypothetical protein